MEPLNLGDEIVKFSKRRISSILKPPRTSMKLLGSEQEEQKEEITKPVEKTRNSRRVSFATTNNVRVFTNDAKSESPVLASTQNTHVGDKPDEKILRFIDEGNHQNNGLETLKTPLYLSQHKENFFSDPVLQDDCVDRTVLLGEDTGYMDITRSHTITIDKDYEIEEEPKPDCSFKVAQMVCGDLNVASQKGLPREAKAESKNAATDPDFSAFLAGMCLPTVNAIKSPISENELDNVFVSANTSTMEIDKENHLPSFLMKQHPGGKGNPKQPRGLQRRRSRVTFVEDDNIEATMSHTVVNENKDNAQLLPPSVSENQGSVAFMASAFSNISDDMELTLSQTAAINVKVTGNITRNVQAALDHNRSHYFSEDDNAMEMTGPFDLTIREKDHTMSMKEQSQSPVPKIRRISSFNVIGNGDPTDQNKAGYFQSNLSITKTANSDDMEMTTALDISIREKEDILFPKLSQMSAFGNGETVDQNKCSSMIAPATNNDDMEMTQCQTLVFEAKLSSGNKPFSNSRKSLPLVSVTRTLREDEHAGSIKEKVLHPIPKVSEISCINLVGNKEKLACNNWLSIAQTPNSDDMEMTRSQTIFLEAKQVSGDKPLSSSSMNCPRTSVFTTEDSDGMDITQAFTGRIIQNALSAKKERGESILIPVTTAKHKHNETDCMDLTCQPSTFTGISPPSADVMELTGCNTINIDSHQTWLARVDADTKVPFSANQTITVEPMEMTEVHMAPVSEGQHNAFMTRRKSGARMVSLMCDPENTEADNCQTNFSNPDDMDLTQCQTVVLEAENCKPFSKSRKSLNLESTFSSPDVDGVEITQALTGNIMLKSFVFSKEREQERNLLPTAQSCQRLDESDCLELTCQASASNPAMPCVDDEMELTGCNTIAIDSKSTLAASASEIKANESALWASKSVSRCMVSSEEQNEVSEAAKCDINHDFPSKHAFDLDGKNHKCNDTETMSYDPAEMQVDKFCKMAHPSNVMITDEENDMQVTEILTMPIEMEKSVSFNQREAANINTSRNEEEGQVRWSNKEQSTSSVQLDGSSSNESVADSFTKEELKHTKARRRSLADFQMELQNIKRRVQEEQKEMMGSTTAPLPCSFPEISLKEQCEMEISTKPASNVKPNIKQKNNSGQTTPLSLKKPFSSRMSFCGIVPKLPKRASTVTPNKTVTISTNDLQSLQLEKHFVVEQNGNCKTVCINDEEFPEMSSEEDLSGSLENWPINKQSELDGSLAVPINEESFEDDRSDTGTSPCFKRLHSEEDPITAEQTKKVYISDMGPDCHEAAVQWEGNFTGHAAQNPKARTIEDTGVSESTFRYSQFDSHMDGMLDHGFDFNKKLEDGSITVNEFLSHFGINFVVHRSRPSALPVSCRAGDARSMEDLLKEKYIYHPKQRVYERDCKNLTEIVERLKERMPNQEKSLGCINGVLQQQICTLSEEQIKSFGSKLKERRVYFGKRSKARSHEMKEVLYSELIKTTQNAKQSLLSKIKETDEMMEDLDGCINDLETELATVEAKIMGDPLDAPQTRPDLKVKQEDVQRLNSAIAMREREIDELEIQRRALEGQQEKLQGETSSLKSHLATLNSLNEWRLDTTNEKGALFTLLHNTVHLQVNLQTPAGKEWMTEDVERKTDICFQLLLDVEMSECHASMVHKLLALYCQSQTPWTERYPTTRHIPQLLHDISLVVSRLRLLGEEIHRLKKWGGLKLRILKITCIDTRVHVIFSSLKAFEKFELNLMVTPDYPFGPLHIQDFKKHIGNTRLSQIEDILSSIKPAKDYLTKFLKKIHDDLLC